MNNQTNLEKQTNNSLFTDIELDEAEKVNGGWSTYSSYYLSLLNQYQASRSPYYRAYSSSGFSTASSYYLYLMNLRRYRR